MNYNIGDRIECDLEFTAVAAADKPDGYVKGIASSTKTDLYGHKVVAGAFDKSIKQKGLYGPKGVKLLMHHDWHKPAGVIKRLETVDGKLEIEAQLALTSAYVKDLYEVTKLNGGLSFSVGFRLEEFEFVDEDQVKSDNDAWIIIKQGDLIEVSVVCFPACPDAEMSYIKNFPPNTMAEFERSLVINQLCQSRVEAHRITLAVKNSMHLFQGRQPPSEEAVRATHPLLDVSKLKPMADLIAKARATLSSR